MKLKWLAFLWPLVFVWPLFIVWRGPSERYAPPAPYKIGDITLQNRDNPKVRDLVAGLGGKPITLHLPGCKQKGKLPSSCKKPVFLYLLSWQGDPLQVRIMLLNLGKKQSDWQAMERACKTFPPPSMLGSAMPQTDALWKGACKKLSAMKKALPSP